MHRTHLLLALLLQGLSPGLLMAGKLRVAGTFTDNAVLQQGVKLPVWGSAPASQEVTVRFAGQSKTVQAAEDGSWRVELLPLQAKHMGQTMTVRSGKYQQEFHNLLVGEVWYASGQSNMQMTLGACVRKIPALREIIKADREESVRFLRIDEPDAPQPIKRREKATLWQLNNSINRTNQSAVAYFFARALHKELDVPIGIIEGSWGGKPIEGFIPRSQFEEQPHLQSILKLAEQDKLDELSRIEGGFIIRNKAGMPGRIFNSRVAPIAPYPVRGFIWYQGESNAGRGEDPRNYRVKMRALVNGWRTTWGQPELPFYFVQLPSFQNEAKGWIRLREEQRRSLDVQNSGMAVTIDLRDSDIHPANKFDVGNRLANWALAKTYGKRIPHSGPLFKSMSAEGDSMRVEFDHADSGLMVAHKEGLAAPTPTPDLSLSHFELANDAGEWFPAQATIEGSTVVVRSPDVAKPQAVRYACSGAPANANLYNREGLPASPFCSDLQLLPWDHQQ